MEAGLAIKSSYSCQVPTFCGEGLLANFSSGGDRGGEIAFPFIRGAKPLEREGSRYFISARQ